MNVANIAGSIQGYNPAAIFNPSAGGTTAFGTGGALNFSNLNPQTLQALQAMGWTGGSPIQDTEATGNAETGGGGYNPGGFSFSPQFLQWAQQNGVSPSITAGSGNSQNLMFNGPQGQIGTTQNAVSPSDMDAFMAGAGGIAGFGALAAAGGVGGAGAAAGSTANAGGLAETGLPEYSAYGGAGAGASAPLAGDATGTGIFDAAGATGGAGGLSSSDAAALYGTDGYGAGASAADLAAYGGGSGGGIGSTLGDIASWAKANPTLVGAGGSLINGLLGYSAASNAAGVQANAASNAAAAQLAQYNQTRADQAPWRAAGATALGQIGDLMGTSGNTSASNYGSLTHQFNAADLSSNLAPNYQFMLNQGLGATTNAGNAAGFSGNTLQGINNYAQGYASNAYQQAFNNYTANQTNIFNRLSNIAGLGQTANQSTDQLGLLGTTTANNFNTSGAAATAAGIIGGTNQATNAVNNISGWNYLAGSGYSDERLKTDIHKVGKTDSGLGIYSYRYKVGGPTQLGVIAQEVEKIAPEAVSKDAHGFRRVNYTMLRDI